MYFKIYVTKPTIQKKIRQRGYTPIVKKKKGSLRNDDADPDTLHQIFNIFCDCDCISGQILA